MAFEEVARVFFYYSVERFVRFGERIEWVGSDGKVVDGLGIGEDVEQNLWGECIKTSHAAG
jgi:hypothetical protein